jgi:predicted nucleotidyltransferase
MTTKNYILATLKSSKSEFSKLGVSNIGLFGSYIRNEQTSESDIDILIDFEPGKETFDNFMLAYDLFENLFKNEKIEVVTRNGLSQYIGPKILNDVQYV